MENFIKLKPVPLNDLQIIMENFIKLKPVLLNDFQKPENLLDTEINWFIQLEFMFLFLRKLTNFSFRRKCNVKTLSRKYPSKLKTPRLHRLHRDHRVVTKVPLSTRKRNIWIRLQREQSLMATSSNQMTSSLRGTYFFLRLSWIEIQENQRSCQGLAPSQP